MATSIDEQLEVAGIYADALYDLARAAGTVDDVRAELDEMLELCRRDPELVVFFESAAIDADRREAVIEKLFRGRLSDVVLNTLLVMNRRGRLDLLTALRRAFELRRQEAAGQVEATVTSAVELTADQRQQVEATTAEIAGKQPLIDYVVDPKLLGGLVLQVGDLRFDNSVRSKLRGLEAQLRARGVGALEIGTVEEA